MSEDEAVVVITMTRQQFWDWMAYCQEHQVHATKRVVELMEAEMYR